jgi:hypothetical protein
MSPNSWGNKITQLLESTLKTSDAVLNIETMADIDAALLDYEFDVDGRENEQNRRTAYCMSTLQSVFAVAKNWRDITKRYAYAKTHIGRPGSRFPEPYLDNWADDKLGCRLKLKARSGQLLLNARQADRGKAGGCAARCLCCDENSPETLQHFLIQCPAFNEEREAMVGRVHEALDALARKDPIGVSMSVADFDCSGPAEKVQVLLGSQTGCPVIDTRIDRACRKYLKRCWVIRETAQLNIVSLS